jgi:hypothetical protein
MEIKETYYKNRQKYLVGGLLVLTGMAICGPMSLFLSDIATEGLPFFQNCLEGAKEIITTLNNIDASSTHAGAGPDAVSVMRVFRFLGISDYSNCVIQSAGDSSQVLAGKITSSFQNLFPGIFN